MGAEGSLSLETDINPPINSKINSEKDLINNKEISPKIENSIKYFNERSNFLNNAMKEELLIDSSLLYLIKNQKNQIEKLNNDIENLDQVNIVEKFNEVSNKNCISHTILSMNKEKIVNNFSQSESDYLKIQKNLLNKRIKLKELQKENYLLKFEFEELKKTIF